MTDAYHGTPITPNAVLEALGPRNFCVSFYHSSQISLVQRRSKSTMIDNGAFSAWMANLKYGGNAVFDGAYWSRYYEFVRKWLRPETDWFVIPDVIDAGTQEQDALIRECPADLMPWAVPVWHMDEPISRLSNLCGRFDRVCVGSTAEYAVVGSPEWRQRMDEAFDELVGVFGKVPKIHMLRGLQCLLPTYDYPFFSVDSTNIGRNHNRLKGHGDLYMWAVLQMINRWDRMNCPAGWVPRDQRQLKLFA